MPHPQLAMFPWLVHGRVVVPRSDVDYTSVLRLLCIFMGAHSLTFVFWAQLGMLGTYSLFYAQGSFLAVFWGLWGARNGTQVSHV